MGFFIEAEAKIRKDSAPELYSYNFDKAVAEATAETLINFCKQSDDFAKAVVEGCSFKSCIEHIAQKTGRRACSDFVVYGMAVNYYFPEAKVEYTVNIVLPEQDNKIVTLNLLDFLKG